MNLLQNFISIANLKLLSSIVYIIEAFHDDGFQKDQMDSSFQSSKPTTSPVQPGTSEISTVKERSHITNAPLKS